MSPQPSHWPRYPNRPPAEFTTSRKSPPSPNSPGHARSLWQLSGAAISLCYRRSGCQHICCNRATVRNIGKRIQAASAGSSAIWNRCLSKKRSGERWPGSAPIRQESSACTSSITPPRTPPSRRVRLGDHRRLPHWRSEFRREEVVTWDRPLLLLVPMSLDPDVIIVRQIRKDEPSNLDRIDRSLMLVGDRAVRTNQNRVRHTC